MAHRAARCATRPFIATVRTRWCTTPAVAISQVNDKFDINNLALILRPFLNLLWIYSLWFHLIETLDLLLISLESWLNLDEGRATLYYDDWMSLFPVYFNVQLPLNFDLPSVPTTTAPCSTQSRAMNTLWSGTAAATVPTKDEWTAQLRLIYLTLI